MHKHIEESSVKIEAACTQMETVCSKLKTEKSELETLLKIEKESVFKLREQISSLEMNNKIKVVTIITTRHY